MPQHESIALPYDMLVAQVSDSSEKVRFDDLIEALQNEWLSAYSQMCNHEPNVLQFLDQGFTFLFDQVSANGGEAEDRLVAGYGHSMKQRAHRDRSRIRGFLGGRIEIPGKGVFDKGHVLAHAMGGGFDVNLFPQRPELNRGRSVAGKTYRKMEDHAAKHPATFTFSRLLYSDETWVPAALENGILTAEGKLWVEQFSN